MKKLTIVKIGGHIVDDQQKLQLVLKQFSSIKGLKLLVHGGGKKASQISLQMGVIPKMVEGRRITDAESLKITQMVYAGLINTNIVAKLQSLKCNAFGMNGADGNSILAIKRPIKKIDYGYVGDVTKVNANNINQLLAIGIVPVFCALTHDAHGQILNTNADTITAELGIGLSQVFEINLVYCFEKKGVLKNLNDDNSIISHISKETYLNLKSEKIIADGMIPKIDNALDALNRGVQNVFIIKYDELQEFKKEEKPGTRISL
ncbi:MAG: acetylglutamate kinase [Calditrichaeota bacterium]|nr:MAG: acetylglutamate kinase [Calditrichota bacterium]MBL1205725.1 acetylglutamate kinase [Calditrichota bacterium]NOG45553.1 acetylglutamate kinase [Calditrichota bacterium]